MPRLLIDLEQVCGYRPSTREEYEHLRDQIRAAFYDSATTSTTTISTSVSDTGNNVLSSSSSNPQQPDDDDDDDDQLLQQEGVINTPRVFVVAPQFDQRATELLDAGMAYHITNTNTTTTTTSKNTSSATANAIINNSSSSSTRWVTMEYPDYLGRDDEDSTILRTAQLWKTVCQLSSSTSLALASAATSAASSSASSERTMIHNSSSNHHKKSTPAFLDRLFSHLQHCHRNLLWKYDMGMALQDLIRDEQQYKLQVEYDEWCRVGRSQQLSRLYQVRETLHQRHGLLQHQVQVLQEQRDDQVQRAMMAAQSQSHRSKPQNDNYDDDNDWSHQSMDPFANEFPSLLMVGDRQKCQEATDAGWLPRTTPEIEDESDDDEDDNNEEEYAEDVREDDVDDNDNGIHHPHEDSTEPNELFVNDDAIIVEGNSTYPDHSNETSSPAINEGGLPQPTTTAAHLQQSPPPRLNKNKNKKSKRNMIEDRLRDQFTTPHLRRLEAMEQSLLKKVEEVDNLLESLQDEEWAAEEEEEDDGRDDDTENDDDDDIFGPTNRATEGKEWTFEDSLKDDQQVSQSNKKDEVEDVFSLLDQILAMILGRLDPVDDQLLLDATAVAASSSLLPTTRESHRHRGERPDHVQWVQQEHQSIVAEWRAYFGRLPPSPTTTVATTDSTSSISSSAMNEKQTTTTSVPMEPSDDEQSVGFFAVGDGQLPAQQQLQLASDAALLATTNTVKTASTAVEKRLELGIADNDQDDWDNIDNWDEMLSTPPVPSSDGSAATIAVPGKESETKAKGAAVGLRPGGKVKR